MGSIHSLVTIQGQPVIADVRVTSEHSGPSRTECTRLYLISITVIGNEVVQAEQLDSSARLGMQLASARRIKINYSVQMG